MLGSARGGPLAPAWLEAEEMAEAGAIPVQLTPHGPGSTVRRPRTLLSSRPHPSPWEKESAENLAGRLAEAAGTGWCGWGGSMGRDPRPMPLLLCPGIAPRGPQRGAHILFPVLCPYARGAHHARPRPLTQPGNRPLRGVTPLRPSPGAPRPRWLESELAPVARKALGPSLSLRSPHPLTPRPLGLFPV